MRLDQIKLVRFGELVDRAIDGFQPGLNILFGPNEIGKSTLLGAIRFVLFGAAFKEYGAEGGRHVEAGLSRDGLAWTLCRKEGKGKGAFQLRPADGGPPAPADSFSRDWLGGTTLATYRSVYALGLDDLKLDGELKDLILVQADPMGNRLRDALDKTAAAAGELLASAAQRPVNAALGAWKQADDDVIRLSQQPKEMSQKELELRTAEKEVARLDGDLLQGSRDEARCTEMLNARDAWAHAVVLRRDRDSFVHAADFSPAAVTDYQAAKQRLDSARAQAAEARSQMDALRRQSEALRIDRALLDQADAVERLAEGAAQLHDIPERLRDSQQKALAALTSAQHEAQAQCGHEVSVTTLGDLDTSAAVQSDLEVHAAALEQAKMRCRQALAAWCAAGLECERAETDVTEAEERLRSLPAPADLASLSARASHLEEWEHVRGEYHLAQAKHEAARGKHDALVAQQTREQEALARAREREDTWATRQKASVSGWRRRQLLFGVAGTVLVAGGGVVRAAGQPALAPALFGAGAACLALALLTVWVIRQAMAEPAAELPQVTVTAEEIQASGAAPAQCASAMAALQSRLTHEAAQAGLNTPDATSVRSTIRKLREQVQSDSTRRTQVETQLSSARAKQKRAAEDMQRLDLEKQSAQEAEETAKQSWSNLLLSRGFPPKLSPGGALAFLKGARDVQGKLREHQTQTTAAVELSKRLDGFRERADTLAATLGTATPVDDPWALHAVRQWNERLKENRERAAQRSSVIDRMGNVNDQQSKAEAEEKDAEAAMQDALQRGRAADENELLGRQRDHQEWLRLDGLLWQAENQLRALRSEEEWQAFKERLQQADWTVLDEDAARLADRQQGLKDERDRIQQTIGQLQEEIKKLRKDEALADAQARREQARARIVELGRDWAAYAAANTLLTLTRTRFEAQRQPEAVRRTGALFGELTAGRWGDIVARDGTVFVARAQDGCPVEREPERLSRGARDALMLCARLAAIEQAVERFPLPVALDDTLVNLDRQRHERALQVIARLAEKTQVLLFTCHEHTVGHLERAGIAYHRVDLDASRAGLPLLPGAPPGSGMKAAAEVQGL